MGNESDFRVDTNGQCFICLKQDESPKFGESTLHPNSDYYSLRCFSAYLKMDIGKFFKEQQNSVSTHLPAQVTRSKLNVALCEDCASLTEKFSQLCQQRETIEMKMTHYLNIINGKLKLKRKEGTPTFKQTMETSSSTPKLNLKDEIMHEQDVANVLRAEALEKCSHKLSCVTPRVIIQNSSRIQAQLKSANLRLILTSQNITGCGINSNEVNPDETSDPEGEVTFIKVESCGSPPNSASEPDDDDDNDNGNCHMEQPSGNMQSGDWTLEDIGVDPNWEENTPAEEEEDSMNEEARTNDLPISSNTDIKVEPGTVNPGKHECCQCLQRFSTNSNLHAHYRTAHLKVNYCCSVCGQEFKFQSGYIRHHKSAHSEIRFQCEKCKKTFTRSETLKEHQTFAHSKSKGKFPCKFCSSVFQLPSSRTSHVRKKHRSEVEKAKGLG